MDSYPAVRPLRWRITFGSTLALAMGIGPLAIYVLSALGPLIIEELGLTRTQFGALATLSYLLTASLSIAGGGIIDSVGGQRVMLALFVIGGAALAGVSIATTYAWLLVAVALSGLTQSLSNPVTNQLIGTLVPPGRRGLLMGVKQSGVQMCQFLAGATLPAAAVAFGWRAAVSTTTVLAFLGIGLVFATIPARASGERATRRRAKVSRGPLPAAVWWLTSYSFLIGAGLQATNVYLPLYAFEEIGLGAVMAGATTGVLGAVGVASRMGWGRISERMASPQQPLLVLALGAIAAVALLFLAASVGGWLIWIGVTLHALTAVAANVVVMMAIVRCVGRGEIGRGSGVLSLGLYLGFAVGPIFFGALADLTGTYSMGWGMLATIYVAAALLIHAWSRQDAGPAQDRDVPHPDPSATDERNDRC